MTPALTAAAERLISLPGFRWMPGMVDVNGNRVAGPGEDAVMDGYCETVTLVTSYNSRKVKLSLPDLTDPATLGCVLAMVREAYSDPGITLRYSAMAESYNCVPWFANGDYDFRGNSEAEALVNALAAAAGAE